MEQTPLTVHDRCDRCGARACARTSHLAGDLLWCVHHYGHFSRLHQVNTTDTLASNLTYYRVWWEPDTKSKEPARA
jgi:hypothetical protein